jgi:hypothetical protein
MTTLPVTTPPPGVRRADPELVALSQGDIVQTLDDLRTRLAAYERRHVGIIKLLRAAADESTITALRERGEWGGRYRQLGEQFRTAAAELESALASAPAVHLTTDRTTTSIDTGTIALDEVTLIALLREAANEFQEYDARSEEGWGTRYQEQAARFRAAALALESAMQRAPLEGETRRVEALLSGVRYDLTGPARAMLELDTERLREKLLRLVRSEEKAITARDNTRRDYFRVADAITASSTGADDLVTQARSLREQLTQSQATTAQLHAALTRIACFDDGPVVTDSFDERSSATVARVALAGMGHVAFLPAPRVADVPASIREADVMVRQMVATMRLVLEAETAAGAVGTTGTPRNAAAVDRLLELLAHAGLDGLRDRDAMRDPMAVFTEMAEDVATMRRLQALYEPHLIDLTSLVALARASDAVGAFIHEQGIGMVGEAIPGDDKPYAERGHDWRMSCREDGAQLLRALLTPLLAARTTDTALAPRAQEAGIPRVTAAATVEVAAPRITAPPPAHGL